MTLKDYERNIYNAGEKRTQSGGSSHVFVMLPFDYAQKVGVPVFVDETTDVFWLEKKALEEMNEGESESSVTFSSSLKCVRHSPHTVCSMMHSFIE